MLATMGANNGCGQWVRPMGAADKSRDDRCRDDGCSLDAGDGREFMLLDGVPSKEAQLPWRSRSFLVQAVADLSVVN